LATLTTQQERLQNRNPELQFSTAVSWGNPPEVIVEHAASANADLIVMTSTGEGMLRRIAFGSVADQVSRTAATPVLIVRRDLAEDQDAVKIRRLVVPLDGSETAERALPVVSMLANQLSVPVVLVTVVDPTMAASTGMNYAAAFSQGLYEELVAIANEEATAMLGGAANQLQQAGINAEQLLLNGSPGDAIVEATTPDDLVVMTSHGRGGIERLLIGSTAEHVLKNGNSAVLLIRQPD